MAERMSERYRIGERVEIRFREQQVWQAGHVRRLEHPGLWVETDVGQHWFVTHPGRIRPVEANGSGLAESGRADSGREDS